jgi:hypothetical protein
MSAHADAIRQAEREWWLRAALVLWRPRPVFAALRDDSDEAAEARAEPILAIVILAGISGVLATPVTGELLNDPEFDGVLIAVWAFVAGLIHGVAGYYVLGALAYLGVSLLGSLGSFRRSRHVVGFAAVPLAFSLVVWPVRIAMFGEDAFRRGGSDTGASASVFEGIEWLVIAWCVALLAIGIRAVHGWSWPRSLAALAVAAAPVVALTVLLDL